MLDWKPDLTRHRTASDYLKYGEAIIALGLAAMVVKLPFRLVVRCMSLNRCAELDDDRTAAAVIVAIDRASRRLPWRAVCFDRGLAAHWMLRRRGLRSVLQYGIGHADGKLNAHVWVTLGDRILIGEDEAAGHACVASFPEQKSEPSLLDGREPRP